MVGLQVQGGGDEVSEDRSKKRKIVAPAAESTNTGTEITTPFGDENDVKAMVMLLCQRRMKEERRYTIITVFLLILGTTISLIKISNSYGFLVGNKR